jgi:hypothetical protein
MTTAPRAATFAGAAFVLAALSGPAAAESYKLTMPLVESCHAGMLAVMKRASSDPSFKQQIKDSEGLDMGEAGTPEEFEANLAGNNPVMAGILKQSGCPGADFYKLMTATMEAGFTQMALQVAQQQGTKADRPTGILAENIAFMTQNDARLNAMRLELDAAGKVLEDSGSAAEPPLDRAEVREIGPGLGRRDRSGWATFTSAGTASGR